MIIKAKIKYFIAIVSALVITGGIINVAPMVSVEAGHQ